MQIAATAATAVVWVLMFRTCFWDLSCFGKTLDAWFESEEYASVAGAISARFPGYDACLYG